MSTTRANYLLQEIEKAQSEKTIDALAEGLKTIPSAYYSSNDTFEVVQMYKANAWEIISVILTRAKIKSLSDEKKWRPVMEVLRSDLKAVAPVLVGDDGEGRRYIRTTALVSPLRLATIDSYNNKAIDAIMTGVNVLAYYDGRDYKKPISFYRASSMYYDNGDMKPSKKWTIDKRTPIEEAKRLIGRYIEGHRTESKKELQTEVVGTNGRKYRRANMLEAFTGNNDASDVVARYTNILSKEEKLVFMSLYVNDHTREQTADNLGITKKSVEKAVERIKDKIIKAGLVTGTKTELKEDNTGKKIDVYGRSGDYIGRFESIKKASEALGIRRSHAQDVLAGRRKAASGYVFSYVDKRPLFDENTEEEKPKKVIVFGHTTINDSIRKELIKSENEKYKAVSIERNIPSITDGKPSEIVKESVEYFSQEDGRKLAMLWEERRAEVKAWEEERKKAKPVTCGKSSAPVVIPPYTGKRSEGLKAVYTHDRTIYDTLVKDAYKRRREEALKAYIEKYGE